MHIFANESDRIPELPKGPVSAYRLAGNPPEDVDGPGMLHGCRIVRKWPLEDASSVRQTLMDLQLYGDREYGGRCFFPGFAFSFGEKAAAIDVLVCLECDWVVFHSTQKDKGLWLVPSVAGHARLEEIYRALF